MPSKPSLTEIQYGKQPKSTAFRYGTLHGRCLGTECRPYAHESQQRSLLPKKSN